MPASREARPAGAGNPPPASLYSLLALPLALLPLAPGGGHVACGLLAGQLVQADAERLRQGPERGHTGVLDGTSNTLLASETVQGVGSDLRGFTWWAPGAQFTTVNPPNSSLPDIVTQNCNNQPAMNLPCQNNGGSRSIQAASSRHTDGVNVVLGDGSVRCVYQSINTYIW